MSGLVKLIKKTFKKVVEIGKKVLKSKIFKVILIAAAVVFTGGAILGAMGATGTGFLAGLNTAFQAGLSAIGNVGVSLWNGMKAVGASIKGFMGIGNTAAVGTGGAPVFESVATMSGISSAAGPAAVASAGMHPLTQAALVSGAGNVISGYAKGRAEQDAADDAEKQRKQQDRYGLDAFGNKGNLYDPTGDLRAMGGDPSLQTGMSPQISLDQGPAVAAPTIEAPKTSLGQTMRNKLLASLDSPQLALRSV